MRFIFLLGLAIVTSLDSLGTGVALGLNDTKIRLRAHAVISAVMFGVTWVGVALGNGISQRLNEHASHFLSATLFVAVGIGMLIPLIRAFRANPLFFRSNQGYFVTDEGDCCAVRAAAAAGCVRLRDALCLGVMLSVNNVGGGVGAGLIQISPLGMATVSVIANIFCLCAGHAMGNCLRRTSIRSWAQLIAVATMFAIGIYQLCPSTF